MLYYSRDFDDRVYHILRFFYNLNNYSYNRLFRRRIRMENWEIIWKEADVHTTVHELLERTRKVKGTALDICGETMTFSEFHDR